jgi:hypothetical protein
MLAPNACRSCLVTLAALAASACSADTNASRSRGGATGPRSTTGSTDGSTPTEVPGASNPTFQPSTAGAPAPTDVSPEESCAAISQTADNTRAPADIIFAVDNSGSMDEEIVFVREQLNAFSQQIIDSGVDVRIILITAPVVDPSVPVPPPSIFDDDDDDQDNGICIAAPLGSGTCPADSSPPRYLHVPVEVKSHDALNLFVETYSQWQPQLRPEATKTFVVVTDDNAEDEPNHTAAGFTQSVASLDPVQFANWSFSGIYCFSECPDAAEIGTVYQDLVAQTGGVGGDLCLQDFAPVFDALARSVIGASVLDCEWALPPPPAGEKFDSERVNVEYTAAGATQSVFHVGAAQECGADGGWYYDDNAAPTRLLVCPSTCEAFKADISARLDVLFGCATKGPH